MVSSKLMCAALVFPNFNQSIVNISATLAQFLGKPTNKTTLPILEKALQPHYRNVVYLVVDGMGSRILAKNLPANSFLRQHQAQEVTSIFPSTTAAATTSIISAQYPGEHGWFAWSVDFDGQVIELFVNRNFYTKEPTADPDFANHQLPYTYFFTDPKDRDLYLCMPADIRNKMHAPHYVTFKRLGQMCRQLKKICHRPQPKFVYAYYSELDTVMHEHGTTSRQAQRLLRTLDRKLAKLLAACPDTLFVITADHGQIDLQGCAYICNDPQIMACLEHPISLDPRGACFKVYPEKREAFVQAFQAYADDFKLFTTQEMINLGAFGKIVRPELQKHLGDFIAVGTDTRKMLVFAPGKENRGRKCYRGHHTGMTPDEMYVPLIIAAQPPQN